MRQTSDFVKTSDIQGGAVITRQANFSLFVLQASGTTNERADASEFLFDFVEWLDGEDHARHVPVFGDNPPIERTWATSGQHVGDWESDTKTASIYLVTIHKIYAKGYRPVF